MKNRLHPFGRSRILWSPGSVGRLIMVLVAAVASTVTNSYAGFFFQDEKAADDTAETELANLKAEKDDELDLATERLLQILRRRPHFGTAFDRLYQQLAIDQQLSTTIDRLAVEADGGSKDNSASAAMLAGMLQLHRGHQKQAIALLQTATLRQPDDAIAHWYLGKAFIVDQQREPAVAALRRGLELPASRGDLIDMSIELGRILSQMHQDAEAMSVWQSLQNRYPDDSRLRQQIAEALVETNHLEEAQLLYDQLMASGTDPMQRIQFGLEAAILRHRRRQSAEALERLQQMLATVRPGSWVFAEIRDTIENVLIDLTEQPAPGAGGSVLNTSEQPAPTESSRSLQAVVDYYIDWLRTHPDDLDARRRLARTYQRLGEMESATSLLKSAISQAPDRGDLRQAYIELLLDDGQWESALLQYNAWEQISPAGSADSGRLNDWGSLLYECSQQEELDANRRVQLREAASAVWQKMIAVEPNHPQTICRVAQLESRSGNYSRAVELLSDYAREHQTSEEILQHLGEVYWAMNRREEAVSTWKKIAALPEFSNASAEGGSDQRSESRRLTNAIRAARILQRYQLPFEAISLVESCLKVQTNLPADEVPPNDEIVNGWMVLSDFLVDAGQWEDALSALRTASKASKSTETRRLALQKQVNVLRAMGGLEDSIRMLSRTLTDQPPQTTSRDGFFEGWWQLALLYEANQQLPEAADAITQAVRISENAARDSDSRPSISLLTTAMTICESALQFEDAISFAEQLVRSDSENAFDHLSHLIELHERAFRAGYSQHKQRIVKASDRLMEVFPDRPETWLRVSEVQLHNNWVADGIQTLMKAAVRFPEDQSIQMAYGYALSQHGQISEAITYWWGLFDKATSYPQRAAIVELLAPLYGRLERCEALISEIHDRTASAAGSREAELLAVTAWRAAGNVSMARQTLQSLLDGSEQDVQLLRQLSVICEQEGRLALAIDYQRRVAGLTGRLPDSQSAATPEATRILPGQAAQPAGSLPSDLSPDAERLYELLIRAASELERNNQGTEACQYYAQALRLDPNRFAANFETYLQSFEYAKQLPVLGQALLETRPDAFADQQRLTNWLIAELARTRATGILAERLRKWLNHSK